MKQAAAFAGLTGVLIATLALETVALGNTPLGFLSGAISAFVYVEALRAVVA